MGKKDRASNRPRRAGRGPKNNPSAGSGGVTRPNKGASTGNTGRGTTHSGHTTGGCMLAKVVGATILAYVAATTAATIGAAFA